MKLLRVRTPRGAWMPPAPDEKRTKEREVRMIDPTTEAKAPIPLRDPAGEVVLVMCGGCRAAAWSVRMFGGAGPGALDECYRVAREHCAPNCERCGAPRDTTCDVVCRDCRAAKEREGLHAAFVKAKKVPLAEYGGEMVTDRDLFEFTSDVDADTDHALELDDGTRFVWGTYAVAASVDLERECKDSWLEEHHDAAHEGVDWAKMREAQELVDEALNGVTSVYADLSIAVVLPPREVAVEEDRPFVCPGCHAVGGEKCAPGCLDAEREELARAIENGDVEETDPSDGDEASS